MNEYSKTYEIRFSDLDANRHVNYAAYANAAGDLCYRFLARDAFQNDYRLDGRVHQYN